MNNKTQTFSALREQMQSWEALLAGLSEEQASARPLSGDMSIKDVVIHLWAWQQRSVARTEAALNGGEPHYPRWNASDSQTEDPDEDVDAANAWIYETYKDKPWPSVHEDWRAQFERLIEMSEKIPEKELLDPERYAWMGGYPLHASLLGTYEHHQEHMDELRARPNTGGSTHTAG